MSETKLSNEIALELSRQSGNRIKTWRNNVGVAVAISARGAKFSAVSKAMIATAARMGCHASIVRYGLCEGSGDRICIVPVVITQEMVGRTLGQFASIEVKTKTGKPKKEQLDFAEVVRQSGGLAGVVRSVDEALGLVNPLGL